jgi:hypothetical protein
MTKHLTLFIALAWLAASACSTIDVALTKKIDVSNKLKKVAVFPFDVKGAGWGDEFSDAISHCFFKTGRVEVVEREALERILKEQNLSMTGLIDDKSAVKIGQTARGRRHPGRHAAARSVLSEGQGGPEPYRHVYAQGAQRGNGRYPVHRTEGAGDGMGRALLPKYCCSLSLIWDRNDILIESSRYDDISRR